MDSMYKSNILFILFMIMCKKAILPFSFQLHACHVSKQISSYTNYLLV
jgi:hypothetical protein